MFCLIISYLDGMNIVLIQHKVPSVSFQVYAPGFFSRFLESHAVMFQGNAGLKPREGEVTSKPWQWPINYRVSSNENISIYFYEFTFNKRKV